MKEFSIYLKETMFYDPEPESGTEEHDAWQVRNTRPSLGSYKKKKDDDIIISPRRFQSNEFDQYRVDYEFYDMHRLRYGGFVKTKDNTFYNKELELIISFDEDIVSIHFSTLSNIPFFYSGKCSVHIFEAMMLINDVNLDKINELII